MQDLIGKLVKDELNMIEIQAGTLMEDALKEQVYIPTFYISKLPITFEVWNAIMNEERQCPFHRIEWDEYKQFIKQLKDLTNINFSIPTYNQWEYAVSQNKMLRRNIFNSKEYLSIGLFNLRKMVQYDVDENIAYQLLCSMGNGHEEIYFILSATDIHSHSRDIEKIQNILNKINEIKNSPNTYISSVDSNQESLFEEGQF